MMRQKLTELEARNAAIAAALSWRSDGTVIRIVPLTGGTSGPAFRLDLALPEGERSVVWRQPYAAASARLEFHCLRRVRQYGVPAPEPLAFSEEGWSLMAFVPGGPPSDVISAAEQCADCLAAVHRVSPDNLEVPAAHDRLMRWAEGDSPHADELRRLLPEPPDKPVLLHGDLWPGNTLWSSDGRLAALIDWESAMLGDPWADIGAARLEILWAWGREAMEAFTARFAAQTSALPTALPAWEIAAVIRLEPAMPLFGLSPKEEARHRRLMAEFLAEARNRVV